jgi:hypothetical protein
VKKPRRTALRLLLLFALLPTCAPHARATQERRAPAPQPKAKQTAKSARDAKERERRDRQQAAAAVNEAVASASEIKDSYKRTLLLALAADALWTFDEQAARSLFARAWEAAVASDEGERAALKERFREQDSAQGTPDDSDLSSVFTRVTDARRAVLAAASRRDARLTERYLAQYRESVERGRGEPAAARDEEDDRDFGFNFGGFSNHILDKEQLGAGEHMRLELSQALADAGDYSQATDVALNGVAGGVSAALIRFLVGLRRDAPAEADALYRQLLARTAADTRAGANDVLLLATYALTPTLFVTVNGDGSVNLGPLTRPWEEDDVEDVTPAPADVRREFLNTAATVLLRASAQRPSGERAARQRATTLYFAAARLLPFFEREAPQLAPQMHALRQSAAAELDAQRRDSLSRTADTQSLTPHNPTDPLADEFEYVKRETVRMARDAARQRALRQAVRLKLWDRAREAIAGMEDADLRADSVNVLAVCMVADVGEAFDEDEDGDERAAQFVEQANVPPLTRALGYAQAALLASKLKRPARAAELLERARTFAEQTDAGREARFVALLVVATAAEQAAPPRAWPLLPALVRAANEAGDAPADELAGGFRVPKLEGAENVGIAQQLADYRLDELFAALARRDSTRALREARGLADVTTRGLVTVAAAHERLAAGSDATRKPGSR